MAATRNTHYATIVYPESAPADWIDKLEEQHIQALISPIHNKDIDKEGNPKKPHYHVVLIFESLKSQKQVKEITDQIGGVGVFGIHSLGAYSRYLCHLDNAEKAQYKIEDVKTIGGANYRECCRQNENEDKENEAKLIELLDLIIDNNITYDWMAYKLIREEHPDLVGIYDKRHYTIHSVIMSLAVWNEKEKGKAIL